MGFVLLKKSASTEFSGVFFELDRLERNNVHGLSKAAVEPLLGFEGPAPAGVPRPDLEGVSYRVWGECGGLFRPEKGKTP
jgi:hypothetical protein